MSSIKIAVGSRRRYHWVNSTWWRHQMETFSAWLAICAGNSPVPGEFPTQRPVTWSFDIFFDLRLNKRLSKQSWGWWFETLLRPFWRHSNDLVTKYGIQRWFVSLVIVFQLWNIGKYRYVFFFISCLIFWKINFTPGDTGCGVMVIN